MTAVLAFTLFAATLDVVSLPVASPEAHVFLALSQVREPACVCVLEGNRLSLYALDDAQQPARVFLDPATGPVDVADLDGDGLSEVICIAQDRILRYTIPQSGQADVETAGTEMFSLQTQLSAASGDMFPYVLVVPWEGVPALALPTEQAFEIRGPDGALKEAFAVGDDAPQRVTYGRPFTYWAATPPQAGTADALELVVNRISSYEPVLPADVLPVAGPHRVARSRGVLRARNDKESHERWLWFPLETEGERRVFFALAPPAYNDTLLVIQKEIPSTANEEAKTTPPLRYPGILLSPGDDLPDLNGDGYTDILLWSAPEPGVSVDALTRAVLGRTWPIRVTAHLFDPERQRYEAKPRPVLECRVPVGWFIGGQEQVPLRNVVIADFDGDGRTDIGGSCEENRYTFWLSREESETSFSHVFEEPIESTVFSEDIRDNGRTVVGVRTRSAVHVLQVPF